MQAFHYRRADEVADAVHRKNGGDIHAMDEHRDAVYLAGGTTLLDLMKLGTLSPAALIDIKGLAADHAKIDLSAEKIYLGALATMASVADDKSIQQFFPVIAQSLALAASPQIRNMATLGGNVLQRTRCNYFRDPSWPACNKRVPGSGCGALTGVNRKHAILGVSDDCIAAYPGDLAQALIALDARVTIMGPQGARELAFEDLHKTPDKTPDQETTLAPGDLIIAFSIPRQSWMRRSLYLKIRDRASYEFALASAAVALDLDGDRIREARIALGGVATKPWRARSAENLLKGQNLNLESATAAAATAFADAVTHGGNDFKKPLGQQTLIRALMQAKDLEV